MKAHIAGIFLASLIAGSIGSPEPASGQEAEGEKIERKIPDLLGSTSEGEGYVNVYSKYGSRTCNGDNGKVQESYTAFMDFYMKERQDVLTRVKYAIITDAASGHRVMARVDPHNDGGVYFYRNLFGKKESQHWMNIECDSAGICAFSMRYYINEYAPKHPRTGTVSVSLLDASNKVVSNHDFEDARLPYAEEGAQFSFVRFAHVIDMNKGVVGVRSEVPEWADNYTLFVVPEDGHTENNILDTEFSPKADEAGKTMARSVRFRRDTLSNIFVSVEYQKDPGIIVESGATVYDRSKPACR